jgi:hypothetical protein
LTLPFFSHSGLQSIKQRIADYANKMMECSCSTATPADSGELQLL